MTADWDAALSWLHERLDAEADVARAAGGDTWRASDSGIYPEDNSRHPGPFAVGPYGHLGEEYGAHIAGQSPRAVLRRVDAERLILDAHPRDPVLSECLTCRVDDSSLREEWPCPTVVLLAQQFADVPGFPEVLRMDEDATS